MKITVIGSHLCEDTRNILNILEEKKEFEVEFLNISENLSSLKEYLKYRESEDMYKEKVANGQLGIPLLISEDGIKTFELNDILKK